ncbi:MAG: hypothetical protein AB8F26_07085 [Phycisphaerales bacterium]
MSETQAKTNVPSRAPFLGGLLRGVSLFVGGLCVLFLGLYIVLELMNTFVLDLDSRVWVDSNDRRWIGLLDSVMYLLIMTLGLLCGRNIAKYASRQSPPKQLARRVGAGFMFFCAVFGLTSIVLRLWRVVPLYLESGATP